jgi:hypothetical protein
MYWRIEKISRFFLLMAIFCYGISDMLCVIGKLAHSVQLSGSTVLHSLGRVGVRYGTVREFCRSWWRASLRSWYRRQPVLRRISLPYRDLCVLGRMLCKLTMVCILHSVVDPEYF